MVGGGEPLLLVFRLAQGLDHPDAGNILPHDPHHAVQLFLHGLEHGNAPVGDENRHRDEQGQHDDQNARQPEIHQHGHEQAAQQHHRGPDAEALQLLRGGLHIVAVAGHAADQAGQAHRIELASVEIDGFLKQLLPDVIADPVGVLNGAAVCTDIE